MFDMAIKYGIALLLLLPLALPAYTPHVGNPETTNGHLIAWYTSGFE
jgi:hypothetical protein